MEAGRNWGFLRRTVKTWDRSLRAVPAAQATALGSFVAARRHSLYLTGIVAGTFLFGLSLGSAISFLAAAPEPNRMALQPLVPSDSSPELSASPQAKPPLPAPRIPVAVEALPPLPVPAAPDTVAGEEALASFPALEWPAIDKATPPSGSTAIAAQLIIERAPPKDTATAALPAREQEPAWQRNAVQLTTLPSGPAIAIVIDDVGLNRPGAERSIALPAPVTLAMMTYAEGLPGLAQRARSAGHELMVHMPMQPIDAEYDAGIKVLTVDLPQQELRDRIAWGLTRFDGYVGINNHMGSRFTTHGAGMATLMTELKRRGLMFLDSRTVGNSLGAAAARSAGVPAVERDVFLDHERSADFIAAQLRSLEDLARRRGYAIGIGHPHDITLQALETWIPQARARGISFIPVSAVLSLQQRQLAAHDAGVPG